MYIYTEKISGVKKDYLKHLHGNNRVHIIRKNKPFKLKSVTQDYDSYYQILNLKAHPKQEWRAIITEFQTIVNNLMSSVVNLDELEPSKEFLEERKKQRDALKLSISSDTSNGQRKRKLQGQIVGKLGTRLERYVDGKNCKWVSTTWDLAEIHKLPFLVVYGSSPEQVELMDKLYKIVEFKGCKSKVKFVQFSERELKAFSEVNVHNWINVDEFMKGENKVFKRLVTGYLCSKLIAKHDDVFRKVYTINKISRTLADKLTKVSKYAEENYFQGNDNLYAAMVELAEQNDLFDYEVYTVYKELKAILEKLYFLQAICDKLYYHADENVPLFNVMVDMFKLYKYKMNYEMYNIKLNEDELSVPAEDEIEQLAN
jgi:hypothetical protein